MNADKAGEWINKDSTKVDDFELSLKLIPDIESKRGFQAPVVQERFSHSFQPIPLKLESHGGTTGTALS